MAEIKNIGAQPLPVDQNVRKVADDALKLPNQPPPATTEPSVGRGNIGQPVGLPIAEPTTQNNLMPDVVTGRDASQLIAADKLRANGGHSATDVLLGLNRQPSTLGALVPPPGNLEMLRHLSPASRRKIVRNLLTKQRGQMRELVAVMRDEGQHNGQEQRDENESGHDESDFNAELPVIAAGSMAVYNQRAVKDLEATTKMLDLLGELLGMQDYALSQMGTFAQG